MSQVSTLLQRALAARLDDARRSWMDAALSTAADPERTLVMYGRAPRQIGHDGLDPDAALAAEFAVATGGVRIDRWPLVDAVRVLLLIETAAAQDPAPVPLILRFYEDGDAGEQQSWLRALALLPHDRAFTAAAVDACRTNIVPLFEAIACDTPYPRDHFPEPAFNQMVIKAMFLGVPLMRIVGLDGRRNGELDRIARDLAAERRAAGRALPPDLDLALLPHRPKETA